MNTKDFLRPGPALGETTRRATGFAASFLKIIHYLQAGAVPEKTPLGVPCL
jgi:hypothetical protein